MKNEYTSPRGDFKAIKVEGYTYLWRVYLVEQDILILGISVEASAQTVFFNIDIEDLHNRCGLDFLHTPFDISDLNMLYIQMLHDSIVEPPVLT